jgi:hypothetical protein
MAIVRDIAVQKLRDLTIAVALAAAAAVALISWISAATIPGTAGSAGLTGNAVGGSGQPISGGDDSFNQGPTATSGYGPGVVVTGGSH